MYSVKKRTPQHWIFNVLDNIVQPLLKKKRQYCATQTEHLPKPTTQKVLSVFRFIVGFRRLKLNDGFLIKPVNWSCVCFRHTWPRGLMRKVSDHSLVARVRLLPPLFSLSPSFDSRTKTKKKTKRIYEKAVS